MTDLEHPVTPLTPGNFEFPDLRLAAEQVDPAVRWQMAMVALGRKAVATSDLPVLMQDAAALAAEYFEVDRFGVAEIRPAGLSLKLGLLADPTRKVTELALEVEEGRSLSAYAINVSHPVIVNNLAEEKRFDDRILKRQGIVSALVCPLAQVGEAFGTLGVYTSSAHEFSKEDVLLIESIAHLVTLTTACKRAEQAATEQRQLVGTMTDTMSSLLLMLTADGRIIRQNQACQKTTGFRSNEVKGRAVWSAFLIPEEVSLVQAAFEKLRRGDPTVKFDSFVLTKHGERRRISWTFAPLKGDTGTIHSLLGTGVDITEQCRWKLQAEAAASEAAENRQALAAIQARIESGDLISGQSVDRLPEGVRTDRRLKPRRAYPYMQRVAPMRGNDLPPMDDFCEARCRDISARGFSFLSEDFPNYNRVVAVFGVAPSLMYLMADIRHVTETTFGDKRVYAVGCEYVGRAAY